MNIFFACPNCGEDKGKRSVSFTDFEGKRNVTRFCGKCGLEYHIWFYTNAFEILQRGEEAQ